GFYLIKDLFPKSLLPLLLCSSQNQNRHFNHCWILSFCSLSSSIRGHRTFLLIMDRGWIREPKFSKRYVEGVQSFMQLVRSHFDRNSKVRCPCQDCLNVFFQTQEIVYDHLLIKGIMGSYMQWIYHGEQSQMRYDNEDENEEHDNDDEIQTMLEEVSGRSFANFSDETKTDNNVCGNMSEMEAKFFDKLLEEAERELYPGCKKFSKLLFLVKLLHLKVYNQWSNKSFDMLLELLKDAFPIGETLPKSYYDAKNMLQGLGLGYISIHACKNDCMLYWAEHKDRQECPHCATSRWKIDNGKDKKIPHKVLRYFPLKPRLQRLFMSSKTSVDMRWHKEKHLDEANVLRHPADSEAWKEFDKNHQWFAQEPRNIRLGLATDGFNPFGNMSTSYSMWPVILAPYNLPPWKCMNDPFMIMSLLIPGPQAPGKDIDVYLRPLIDELKELWNDGVETFDASTGKCFKMHAAILWTINDFPAHKFLNYLLFF
ncbi:hypothetical protein AABB24_007665, partial [Solanum stoloniferum]